MMARTAQREAPCLTSSALEHKQPHSLLFSVKHSLSPTWFGPRAQRRQHFRPKEGGDHRGGAPSACMWARTQAVAPRSPCNRPKQLQVGFAFLHLSFSSLKASPWSSPLHIHVALWRHPAAMAMETEVAEVATLLLLVVIRRPLGLAARGHVLVEQAAM